MGLCLSLAVGKKETKKVILPEISEELVIEILMRLPVKSLMRFKCASKRWLSLISSRYLTNLFLESSSSRQRFFVYLLGDDPGKYALLCSSNHGHSDTSVSVIDQDLTFLRINRGNFVNALRGLVCFTFEKRVRIYNLNTRQVVELPVMRSEDFGINIDKMKHYFGHDPVHDEYKVLTVVSDFTKKTSKHQVLVLGAGASWRKIQCHIPHILQGAMTININGVLYYEVSTGCSHVLMSFDLSSEEFKSIVLPNTVLRPWLLFSRTSLMNYTGKIAVFEYLTCMSESSVHVWVLEDAEKSQWSNKKTFVLPLYQMNFVHIHEVAGIVSRDYVIIGGTSHSGKVWLTKTNVTRDRPAPAHAFIYDLERNEITQRIEIKPLRDRIGMILRAIGEGQRFRSVETNWAVLTFWNDVESIMHLEI